MNCSHCGCNIKYLEDYCLDPKCKCNLCAHNIEMKIGYYEERESYLLGYDADKLESKICKLKILAMKKYQ